MISEPNLLLIALSLGTAIILIFVNILWYRQKYLKNFINNSNQNSKNITESNDIIIEPKTQFTRKNN